jgi:hypothetical protein
VILHILKSKWSIRRLRKIDPNKRRKLVVVRGKGGKTYYRIAYVNAPREDKK